MRIPLIIENAEERHMNMLTTYTTSDGSKQCVIITIITSSSDATLVTKKQYVTDNIKERDKPQRIRVLKNIVKITEEQYNGRYNTFTTEERAELEKKWSNCFSFFSSENGDYENINVQDKVCFTIQEKFNKNTVKVVEPVVFDRNQIKTLAEKAYATQMAKDETQVNKKTILYNSQDSTKREQTTIEEQRNIRKQETTMQYNYDKTFLDPKHKKLLETRDALEEKQKQYQQSKASQKKQQETMEKKERYNKK